MSDLELEQNMRFAERDGILFSSFGSYQKFLFALAPFAAETSMRGQHLAEHRRLGVQ